MRFGSASTSSSDGPLNMTAMIDIVFLLLIFFVMTFRIVTLEGEFNIRSHQPPSDMADAIEPLNVPMFVRLHAGVDGQLAGVALNQRTLNGLDELHIALSDIAAGSDTDDGPESDLEVVLDCDFGLKYDHVIDALTAIRQVRDRNDRELIPNVKLAPLQHASQQQL